MVKKNLSNRKLLAATAMATAIFAVPAITDSVSAAEVSTWSELKEAIQAGGETTLTSDINLSGNPEIINAAATATLFMGDNTIDGTGATALDHNLIQATTGDIVVNGGTFQNINRTTEWGSVAHLTGSGNLTINNTKFIDNSSLAAGALSVGTAANSITLNNVTFEGNSSNGAQGIGAVGLYKAGTFNGVTFRDNSATSSTGDGVGALFLGSVSSAGIGNNVSGSLFDGNTSASRAGAIGMRTFTLGNNSDAKLTIENTTFTDNSAATNGGAIDNYFYASNKTGYTDAVYIAGSTFGTAGHGNSAANGGAIYNHTGKSGDILVGGNPQVGNMYITDSTFTNNSASQYGGAIYNEGTMTVGGAFNGNTASSGGAIFNKGTLTIADGAQFLNNDLHTDAGDGTDIFNNGGSVTIGDNLTVTHSGEFVGDCNIYSDNAGYLKIGNNASFNGGGDAIVTTGAGESRATLIVGNNANFQNYNDAAIIAWGATDATIGTNARFDNTGLAIQNSRKSATTVGDGFYATNSGNSNWGVVLNRANDGGDGSTTLDFTGSATFVNNTNSALYNRLGAITTFDGTTLFENNDTTGNGGAVRNVDGTATYKSTVTFNGTSTFTGNDADGLGGAIYNNANGIVTFNGDASFENNMTNTGKNDIYNLGTLNLNGTTSLDGGITGAGTVKLGASSITSMIGEEAMGSSIITASTLNITDGAKIAFDWGDTINAATISGTATKLGVAGVYVDKTVGISETTQFNLFQDGSAVIDLDAAQLATAYSGYKGGYQYTLAQDGSDKHIIKMVKGSTADLTKAVDETTNAIQTVDYEVSGTETYGSASSTPENRTITNAEFTIDGNGNTIQAAAGAKGMIVDSNSILEVNNATFTGFETADANQGTVLTNNNETTINGATFTGNAGENIVNAANAELNVNNSTFQGGGAAKRGRAITSAGTYNNDDNNFDGYVYDNGAAMEITGTANPKGDHFTNNTADKAVRSGNYGGGAIWNSGNTTIESSSSRYTIFSGNQSYTDGGAIFNKGTLSITDADFTNNSASATDGVGGAIYSENDLTINAVGRLVTFSGNTAKYGNDIYMQGTSLSPVALNLNAKNSLYTINLGGGVAGEYYDINVNSDALAAGTVNATAPITGVGTFTLNKGTVNAAGIEANQLDVVAGSLTSTGDITVNTGTNAGAISGTGAFVVGNNTTTSTYTNNGTIANDITINSKGTLSTAGSGFTGDVANAGILDVTGGAISSTITGAGQLKTADGVSIASGKSVTQGSLDVTGTLTNAGALTVNGSITDGGSGAISGGTVNLNGGTSGSYATNAVGITADAINVGGYLDNNAALSGPVTVTGTLQSTLANAGTLTNNGTFKLEGAIGSVAGTGTTILQNNVAVADNYAISGALDVNAKEIDMADGTNYNTLTAKTLTPNSGTLKIDVDGSTTGTDSDKIVVTGNTSTGNISLTDVNVKGYVAQKDDYSRTYQVIENATGSSNALSLGISQKTLTTSASYTYDDKVTANTNWDDTFNGHSVTGATVKAEFALDTDTTKLVTTVKTSGGTDTPTGLLGDTLAMVVQDSTNATRTFDAVADATYTVGSAYAVTGLGTLGGTQLTIDGKTFNAAIDGNNKTGIVIGANTQTLTLNNLTGFDNFSGAAIDNTAGGTVIIHNVTMTGNGTDIVNDGEGTEGLFLSGTNNINSVKDSAGTGAKGQTTISSGTSTIGSLIQKDAAVSSGATLQINAGNLTVTNGVANEGTVKLTGGTLGTNITGTNGEIDIKTGTVTNNATISGKTIAIDSKLITSADKISASNGISNEGTLELTGGTLTSAVGDSGHTDINTAAVTDTVTAGAKINQNVNIVKGVLNSTGTNLGGNVAISNNGTLELNGGDLAGDITGYNPGSGATFGKLDVKANSSVANAVVSELDVASSTALTIGSGKTATVNDTLVNNGTIQGTGAIELLGGTSTSSAMENAGSISTSSVKVGSSTDSAYVKNTGSGAITGAITIASGSSLESASNKLGTTAITNDGNLIFNDANGGSLAQNVAGSSSASNGIVDIAIASDKTFSLNGKTIANNEVKLSSGTFDVTSLADSSHNINVSAVGKGIIAGTGILSAQDGYTGKITIGNIDTSASDLNVAIDLDLVNSKADYLSKTGTWTGSNEINFKNIALTVDAGSKTPDDIRVADTSININNLELGQTTVTGTNIGNLMLTLTSKADGTYLQTKHSDLTNAITSSIATKAYVLGGDESFTNAVDPVALGGTSLSITGGGYTITGSVAGNDGISVAADKTLSISNATLDGFGTALTNAANGTINLTDVTFTNNTTSDVDNSGTLNLAGTIALDNAGILNKGTTNVDGAAVTGKYVQNASSAATNIYGGSTMTLGSGSGITNGSLALGNTTTNGSIIFNNGIDNKAAVTMQGSGSSLTILGLGSTPTTLELLAGTDIDDGAINVGNGSNANELKVANGADIATAANVNIAANSKITLSGANTTKLVMDNIDDSSKDTWAGDIVQSGGELTILGAVEGTAKTGSLQATGGNIIIGDGASQGGVLGISNADGKDSIAQAVIVDIKNNGTLNISKGSVVLDDVSGSADTWNGHINLSGTGNLTSYHRQDIDTTDGTKTYNQNGGTLTLDGSTLKLGSSASRITTGSVNLQDASTLTIDNGSTQNEAILATDGTTENKLILGDEAHSSANPTLTLVGASSIAEKDQVTIATGSSLVLSGTSNVTLNKGAGTDTWNGNVDVAGNSVLKITGNMTKAGKLTQNSSSGAETDILGTFDITTGDEISAGTLKIGNGTTTSSLTTGGSAVIGKNAVVTIASKAALNVDGGTVTLDGADTWTGAISQSAGSLTLDGRTAGDTTDANKTFNMNGGTLTMQDSALTLGTNDSKIQKGSVDPQIALTGVTDSSAGSQLTFNNGTTNAAVITSNGNVNNALTVGGNNTTGDTELTLKTGSNIDKETAVTISANATKTGILNASGTSIQGGGSEGITNDGIFNLTNDGTTAGTIARVVADSAGTGAKGTVNLTGTTESTDGSTITQANIKVDDGTFTMGDGSDITAKTLLNVTDDGNIVNNGANNDIFAQSLTNDGTITGTGNLTIGDGDGSHNSGYNAGTISQADITLVANGNFVNSGTMTSTDSFVNGATITGATGILNVKDGNSTGAITQDKVTVNGDFVNSNVLTTNTSLTNNGNLTNEDTIAGADVTNNNKILNKFGATISADIDNQGGATVDNSGLISGAIANAATGLVLNQTSGDITGGITNDGDVYNSGTIETGAVTNQNGGKITNNSDGTISSTIKNKANSTVDNSGLISGAIENAATGSILNQTSGDITGGITNDGNVYNSGTIETGAVTNQNGGKITNNSDGTISSTIKNKANSTVDNSGLISGAITNEDDATLLNQNGGKITGGITNDGDVYNSGTIKTGAVTNQNGGKITNNSDGKIASTIDNKANSTVDNSGTISGAITNATNGTVQNQNGGKITGGITNDGNVYNSGTIKTGAVTNQNGGKITNNSDGKIASTIDNKANSTVDNSGTISGAITNATNGTVQNQNGGKITGGITNDGNVYNSGTIKTGVVTNQNGGKITNNSDGVITSDLNNKASSTVDNSGVIKTGLVTNDGYITNNSDGKIASDVNNNAGGTLNNYGAVSGAIANAATGLVQNQNGATISGGLTNSGDAYNSGTIKTGAVDNKDGGHLTNNSTGVISSAVQNEAGGLIDNVGTISGHVTNDAADASGTPAAGVVNTIASGITGGVTNNGKLNLNDGDGNQGVLGSDITGAGDTTITSGTVTIPASGKGSNVTQDTVNTNAGTTAEINGNVTVKDLNNNGSTNINSGSAVTADNINNNAGTTTISETVNADKVNANGGDIQVNAHAGDTSSSQVLADKAGTGASQVNIADGAAVALNTGADNYSVDNTVTGTGTGTGALDLIGVDASGYQTADDSAKTKFTIDSPITNATVNVVEGQLNLADESNLIGSTVHVVGPSTPGASDAATINTMDGNSNTYNNNYVFDDQAEVKFDVDAIAKNSDFFANPDETAGNEVLTDIQLQNLDKIVWKNTDIDLKGTSNLNNLIVSDELQNRTFQAMTPIRVMEATIDANGMMNIHPSSGRNDYDSFNPAAVVAPIAAQLGGYLSQLNSYDEAFRNLDMKMLMTREERQAYKMANRYASEVKPQVFSETYLPEKDTAAWFRPYASFEKVNLKHGPNAGNNMYGSYFGGDSSMKELSNGWDFQYSGYVGYNGSHQYYQGVGIYQNGGNLGATGVWYKGDFFTALTANVGASMAEASTSFGNEHFGMLTAGVASKTGYNWELAKGKFIIQPSYLMSYSFVNTFDYKNAAGVNIHSKPLNAINITPGIKFIGNLKNGWQPYAGISMVWSIMDQTDYKANDIPLPEMSVKPYFQYGIGLQKRWGDRFTGFGQLMMRNGGRNGIAMSAGFRWAIGKEYTERTAARRAQKATVIKQQKKDKNIKNVNNSVSFNNSKSGFFSNMNGEPTYVVKVEAKNM